MCMMKNSGEKEACEVAKNLAALDGRVGSLEFRMDKMKASLNDGFKSLSVCIGNLGHDVGERVNIIEKKVVDEKAKHDERIDINRTKWHDTLRKVTLLVTYAILTSAMIAVGINVASQFFPLAKQNT